MPTSFATWPLLGGTILAPSFSVGMDISEGRLIALLTDWRTRELPIQALYPHRFAVVGQGSQFRRFSRPELPSVSSQNPVLRTGFLDPTSLPLRSWPSRASRSAMAFGH